MDRKIADTPNIRLLAVADLHSCTAKELNNICCISEDNFDCIVFLGDICINDMQVISSRFSEKPSYFVLGNHDRNQQKPSGCISVDGSVQTINDVKIGGVSGAPRYKIGDYAMRTEDEVREVLQKLPRVDVFLSHESPYHLLGKNAAHCGYQSITDYIKKNQPVVHIFGHHHVRYEGLYCHTKEVCVYKCALISINPFQVHHVV